MGMSEGRPGTVERAFELARMGSHKEISDIVATLKRERHDAVEAHLAGPSIRKELRRALEGSA
jgi:hypothetical protein